MAKKQDRAAERARKQKIFLAVAGVLFLGLMAVQGPKLLKQVKGSSSTTTAAATTTTSSDSASATPSTGTPAATPQTAGAPTSSATTTTAPVKAPKGSKAELAGVVIVNEQPAQAGEGQLDSFTMFEPKDPFVQKVDPNAHPDGVSSAPASTSTSEPQPSTGSGSGSGSGTATPTGSAAPDTPPADGSVGPTTPAGTKPLAPTSAMLRVNGVLQLVDLKARFPRGDKAFVLRKLTRKGTALIAVAGGSFSKGATLTLTLGRSVTLVNTATGARYVVKLVWLGADSSQVARFTAKAK